jgi:hypothetical protein
MRRIVEETLLAPLAATIAGPEALPAAAFDQRAIDAVLAKS